MELQRKVPEVSLGVVLVFFSFARTKRSRRFGKRRSPHRQPNLSRSPCAIAVKAKIPGGALDSCLGVGVPLGV